MNSSANIGPSRDGDVRERIHASALRLFSQKGYAATSLRELSEEAQTTKPMVYYYFGSKEALYESIVRGILEEMAASIRSRFPGDMGPSEQILAYCERYLDYFFAEEHIIALVLREVFGLGGPMRTFGNTLAAEVRRPLDEVIERAMAIGYFREDEVAACASAVTGILNMFILTQVFGGIPFDRAEALRQVRYYIAGLTAPK